MEILKFYTSPKTVDLGIDINVVSLNPEAKSFTDDKGGTWTLENVMYDEGEFPIVEITDENGDLWEGEANFDTGIYSIHQSGDDSEDIFWEVFYCLIEGGISGAKIV